jgi:hypothetical protein
MLPCAVLLACGALLVAATALARDDIKVEATGPDGAVVVYDAGGLNCDPPSGSTFPLGPPTTVTCKDADGNEVESFKVHVQDTTAPSITVPANITVATTTPPPVVVTYTPEPTATDIVDGMVAVSCSPVSDSGFNAGTTTVNCSASDTRGNSSSASFTVTVTVDDTTPPVIGPVSDITVSTEDAAGSTVVNYSTPTATDNIDGSVPVSCAPASGSSFPVGTTLVNCTAVDSHGLSASKSFNVTLIDNTRPVLSVPTNISEETETNAPKVVTYSVSATDNVDGPLPVNCTPASGSSFAIGTTSVTCTATDSHGNPASASFNVTVTLVDRTAPALTGVPGDRHVEANGPSGSVVNYATPTATDALDGPIAGVTCSPASGSLFPLGTTTVTCSATDAHGNTGSASFAVVVTDTTPPTLVIPISFGIHATSAEGIPRTDPTISGVLGSAFASDIVDPSPVVTNNAPAVLPIGTTDVTITARDATGNGTSKSFSIVVLPQPPAGTPPLPVPPAPKLPDNPKSLNATPGDGTIKLAWAAVPGARQYLVYRSEQGTRRLAAVVHGQLVYSGTARTFTDRGLTNGVEYRYVVVVEDAAGNQSAGVAIVVVPRRDLLRSPKNGARLRKAPRLVWTADGEADYYNAQLVLGRVKVLSVWPTRAQFQLKTSWKFQGRKYTLKPGLYTWYVWPGYGAREAIDYGQLMGSRTFRITKKTK